MHRSLERQSCVKGRGLQAAGSSPIHDRKGITSFPVVLPTVPSGPSDQSKWAESQLHFVGASGTLKKFFSFLGTAYSVLRGRDDGQQDYFK